MKIKLSNEVKLELADVAEAFAQQLALKFDGMTGRDGSIVWTNGRIVWGGDYDSISNEDLRRLVGNYLGARQEVFSKFKILG